MADAAINALFDVAQAPQQYFSQRSCIQCGGAVSHSGREMRKYCSDICRDERKRLLRKGLVKRSCDWCGGSLDGYPSAQKFCSDICREESASQYRKDFRQIEGPRLRAASLEWVTKFKDENPDEHYRRARMWWARHSDKLNAKRRTPEHQEKQAAYARERYSDDPAFRIHSRMASGVYQALKKMKRGRKWESLLGYTLSDLVRHLERQFLPGMSWDNIGDWHIDHIIPRASFSYKDERDDEFKACWALTNLRPLWAKDNISKGAKILTLV